MAMTNIPSFTRYVFIEKQRDLAEALMKRKDRYCPGVNATILNGDCNDHVGSLLNAVSSRERVFVLMDPEGLELKWDATIVPAASHPGSELFINFPYDMAIKRCISSKADVATELTVTEYMGTDAWKELRDSCERGEIGTDELRQGLLDMYTDGLRRLGLREIQVSKLVHGDSNHPLYYLVSASRKRFVPKIMKDIMRIGTVQQQTLDCGD